MPYCPKPFFKPFRSGVHPVTRSNISRYCNRLRPAIRKNSGATWRAPMQVRHALSVALLVLAPSVAQALNPVSWNFNLATTGNDVFWSSPTAVTGGLAEYDWSYHITKLEVRVNVLFLPVDVDVTDQLGDAALGSGVALGLPFVLVDESVVDPGTGTSADMRIEVGTEGFGRASITNVTLGQYNGLNITRIRAEGIASVMGIPQGDYNRDGRVDSADYNQWRSGFGSTEALASDGNRNAAVDAADYVLFRRHQGTDTITSTAATAAVPEPATARLLIAGACFLFGALHGSRAGARKHAS